MHSRGKAVTPLLEFLTATTEDVTMQQVEQIRSKAQQVLRDTRLGGDVLDYMSQCRRKFEKEFEKLCGYEIGLIHHLELHELQSYFPRLSHLSQAYAMPAVNVSIALATQRKIKGLEHLFTTDPMQFERAKSKTFQSDRTIFTIDNPINPKRLARIDAQFAGDIQFDDPHLHGSVHKFIYQIRSAPEQLSKAYLAGVAQAVATLRIASKSSEFDLWMLGLLKE